MNYTAAELGSSWDENGALHDFSGVMVITSSIGGSSIWGPAVQSAFLPLYLTAMFHKCRNCGKCCRAFDSKLARGVELTAAEAHTLQSFCRVTRRAGKHLLKYPCALQQNHKCTRYIHRPFCCRAFPVVNESGPDLSVSLAVFMACPAGKGTYVTASLFLQELRQLARNLGHIDRELSFADLEQLKTKFDPNSVSPADMEYIKETARQLGLETE
ncbi:YkgJ family cysteine cluster protein [Dehalogenimonas sp. THU2]|uniref:YkgJ family cysteine cluster protein n=1 Tax=Dehalogenimonas sp. THU2 TaxID=3151121 RepID=UPI00321880BE